MDQPNGSIIMKALILSIALIACTFVSCDKSQAPTDPVTSSSPLLKAEQITDLPINVVFYNECCGENVSLSGTAHLVLRDNGRHFNVTDITGVGLSSGDSYTGHNTAVHNEHINGGNGAANESLIIHVHATNENGCGFTMKIHLTITVNANGETTAQVVSVETKCD
jgi:hypothetical protein